MPPNNAGDWFQRAENDLLNIENNLKSQRIPWDTVVFHAHQAIEKFLKGLLVANGAIPQRSHDLVELLQACTQFAPAVLSFEQDCRLLNRLYVALSLSRSQHTSRSRSAQLVPGCSKT